MKSIRTLLILTLVLPALALVSSPLFAEANEPPRVEAATDPSGRLGRMIAAQAMAIKAADFLKKEGPDTAFAAFNAGGDWRDGDLYVFVIDNTGTWRASGARPELVGRNDLNTPDADGKLFIKEIVAIDKDGWVDYKFKRPADNKLHDKRSYFVRVGDYLVGAGAYMHDASRE